MTASLTPTRLGAATTIGLGLRVDGAPGTVPPPLRSVELRYPENLGIALSGLGLEMCTASVLETQGPLGCPPNSVMGRGTALGEIPFGPEIIRERATVTVVRAEDESGHIALLFDAQGISPVIANIVLPGELLPAARPFGGEINLKVPLVPSLPEAPDVAVVALEATIGPQGLTYYEQAHGATVPYVPKGILLPTRCPHGGFPFAATLAFEGGGRSDAKTRVRCPAKHQHTARRRRR